MRVFFFPRQRMEMSEKEVLCGESMFFAQTALPRLIALRRASACLLLSLWLGLNIVGYADERTNALGEKPFSRDTDALRLEERALSRWHSLIAGNISQAYEYFSPAYRKLFPMEQFLGKIGTKVDWLSVEVSGLEIEDARAEVELVLYYRINLPPGVWLGVTEDMAPLSKKIVEVWLRRGGEWWYVNPGGGLL